MPGGCKRLVLNARGWIVTWLPDSRFQDTKVIDILNVMAGLCDIQVYVGIANLHHKCSMAFDSICGELHFPTCTM